jgi:phosphoenolpyruvate-protein kinase (PTS system EI component)
LKCRVDRTAEEVNFFSICTNGSFPDTLGIDRTYKTVAGVFRIALPLSSNPAASAVRESPAKMMRAAANR